MAQETSKSVETKHWTPKEFCLALYGACLQQPDKLYSQEELLSLNIIPNNDVGMLAICIADLCNQRRFTNYQSNDLNTLLWKVVKREDAARYKGLSQEESVVLSYVDNSQKEGIWVRHIRTRSGLAQNSVNNALKKLEQRGIVKQITSAKNPARKHYMLAHLQPSEDVTGGPFFTDGALDEDYVFQISKIVFDYVSRQSWEHKSSRSRDSKAVIDHASSSTNLPMPPGYSKYPTLTEITDYVNGRGVSSIRLVELEIKQLLDLLCWDGKLSRVSGGKAYRSVKATIQPYNELVDKNGFAEAPCGQCPVFDWCDDHGSINSRTCVYLTGWLDQL